jgi:glycosyltransferase A (GT-A) superfamily protein (DUF2064 family)
MGARGCGLENSAFIHFQHFWQPNYNLQRLDLQNSVTSLILAFMDCVVLCFTPAEPGKNLLGFQDILDPNQRAKLYQAFMDDALEFSQELGIKRIIACTPNAKHPFFQELLKRLYIELADLPEGHQGLKIKNAFDIAFEKGAKKVVLWDGFAPTLTPKMFKEVFVRLEKDDLVVGPSMDYGTYILGASKRIPAQVFEKVNFGTPAEFSGIVHLAESAKLSVYAHHVWHRLLRKEDLPYFIIKLKEVQRTYARLARHTQKTLKEFSLL